MQGLPVERGQPPDRLHSRQGTAEGQGRGEAEVLLLWEGMD